MTHELLDDDAAERPSPSLSREENRRRNGDASVTGSATMPSYIRSFEACRADVSVSTATGAWRLH
jgi:hypothetical protein